MEFRKVLCQELAALMRENNKIVILDADLAKPDGIYPLFQEFPDRCFQVGIAEANMASICAGRVMKQGGGGRTRKQRAQTLELGPRRANWRPQPTPTLSRPGEGANFKVSSRGRGRPELLARVWGGFLIPQSRAVCSTAVKGA